MFAVGAALTAAASMVAGCSGTADTGSAPGDESNDSGRGPITFAQGKDTTGKLQTVIDDWNADHPDEEVTFIELAESADEQRTAMVQDFQDGAGTYDVAGLD